MGGAIVDNRTFDTSVVSKSTDVIQLWGFGWEHGESAISAVESSSATQCSFQLKQEMRVKLLDAIERFGE